MNNTYLWSYVCIDTIAVQCIGTIMKSFHSPSARHLITYHTLHHYNKQLHHYNKQGYHYYTQVYNYNKKLHNFTKQLQKQLHHYNKQGHHYNKQLYHYNKQLHNYNKQLQKQLHHYNKQLHHYNNQLNHYNKRLHNYNKQSATITRTYHTIYTAHWREHDFYPTSVILTSKQLMRININIVTLTTLNPAQHN